MKITPFLTLILAFVSVVAHAASYDEVYTPNGELRLPYRQFIERTGYEVFKPNANCARFLTGAPLGDYRRISPTPLVISKKEAEILRKGVAQRTRALARFFGDIVLADGAILRAGVIPEIVLQVALSESSTPELEKLRDLWKGKTIADLSFIVGSDVVRDENGTFLVMEDNVGIRIGGLGDTPYILTAYADSAEGRNSIPRLKGVDARGFNADLPKLVRRYLDVNGIIDPGNAIALVDDIARARRYRVGPRFNTPDQRLADLLSHTEVSVCTTGQLAGRLDSFLKRPGRKAILNFFEGAPKLPPGTRDVSILVPEGPTRFLSSKIFLPFIEKMIAFYLGEETILRSVPSRIYATYQRDEPLGFTVVPMFGESDWEPLDDVDRFVFKVFKEAQGNGTNVGRYVGLDEILDWLTSVPLANLQDGYDEIHPDFLLQPYILQSHIRGSRIELRPYAAALGYDETYAFGQIWGKAMPPDQLRDTDGLMNVSQGGMTLPVFVE